MDLAVAPDQLSALAAMVWAWALAFLPRLAAALAILIIGVLIAGWAARVVRGLVGRTGRIDATVQPILATVARYAVLILVIVVALAQLGVQTASLLAVLGAAGLAIGLALQGTLQNIAAGIMLIYLRPFQVGDTIETPAIAGTVREIGLFATEMETGDGLFYFVPNSEIWNKPLKNHSRNPRRLMTLAIRVSAGADTDAARRVLLEMAGEDPRILQSPAPSVHVESYADNAAVLSFRAWTPTNAFSDAQRTMTEEARRRLNAAGIELA